MSLDEKLAKYRMSREEYERACELLGRPLKGVEWALFSALWSEHCSYKSSKVHLKNLFSTSERVVQGFGENAGVVDLGEGERVAFKMESHNHPSFIEPYQGAATGVGGILRDIFTMGARPIAAANYLCFGEPQAPRMTYLVDGVVRGIGGYGNSVGVPMITGQTQFHPSYNGNILVNALAVGYLGPEDKLVTAGASGEGNYVVYAGAKTGRDGVHGASMASEAFEEGSEANLPTIQVGDPFYEKLLIEATLEVVAKDLVVAVQDMGAAGLTSSSFEMASSGGVGFRMDLSKVPVRDATMGAEELLLSESQERMLFVVEPKKWPAFKEVFDHWDLDAEVIGEVTKERKMHLTFQGEVLTEIDPDLIVEEAPQYQRPYELQKKHALPLRHTPATWADTLKVFEKPAHALAPWIYRQFDQRVGAATLRGCESSVGAVRLPASGRSLGLALGGQTAALSASAWVGGWDAIFAPALKLSGLGFEPLAVTDCLNFGNPEKPEIMGQFVQSLEGMNTACRTLKAPIISGNVSFYNESAGQNILPTPSTGLVGLNPSVDLPEESFKKAGQDVYLVDLTPSLLPGAEVSPSLLAELSKDLRDNLAELRERARSGQVKAFKSVSTSGLLYTLAKMSLEHHVGLKLEVSPEEFSRGLYRCVIVSPSSPESWSWEGEVRVQKIALTQKDLLQMASGESVSVSEVQSRAAEAWKGVMK